MSKLRKALLEASISLSWATHGHLTEDDAKGCLAVVDAALAEPLRNCEVGTEEEQAERFYSFCKKFQSGIQGMCSSECPCKECCDMCHCLIKWSQMPYEKGKTDEQ